MASAPKLPPNLIDPEVERTRILDPTKRSPSPNETVISVSPPPRPFDIAQGAFEPTRLGVKSEKGGKKRTRKQKRRAQKKTHKRRSKK
jgi:hypothetical protein